jgi:uncharacterized protein
MHYDAHHEHLKVGVTGASGLIGRHLCRRLNAEAYITSRLVRRPSLAADEVSWNPLTGDIESAKLEGLDAFVHLAGKSLGDGRLTEERKKEAWQSRVYATKSLCQALVRLSRPPRILITASATDWYETITDRPIDEDCTRTGSGFVSEMCQAWEDAARPAKVAGLRVVHLRIPNVLSATGANSMLAAFLPLFRLGLGGRIGTGEQLVCYITPKDLISAIMLIMTCEAITGPVNTVAPQPVTNRELTTTLARVLRRPALMRYPAWLMRLSLGELSAAVLEGDARLVPGKLLAHGFRFEHPGIEAAIRHVLTTNARQPASESSAVTV